MKLRSLFLLAPAALLLTAASPNPGGNHAKPHWTYDGEAGPEHWGELSEDFKACKTGRMQSPIELGVADVEAKFAVRVAYRPGPLTVVNNGHTIQATFAPGSTLSSGISRYKLLQVHFHTPSEEVVYGISYPMVAHFVHIDYAGNLAVLGVLFEEGAHNPELEKLVKAAPRKESEPETVKGVTFDPSKLLPANLSVYRYEGSLTTPPCTEGVRWHVARQRVTASAAQIAALHAIMGDNARPVQPIYGRVLVAGAD
ncbi:carbonic anhydrase family protein [Novosphingobium sp. MW5]|nr:carbonic anhydrase family protein [Novosphingobium sp. MW5]